MTEAVPSPLEPSMSSDSVENWAYLRVAIYKHFRLAPAMNPQRPGAIILGRHLPPSAQGKRMNLTDCRA